MKHKTAELEGALLDAAVAKVLGATLHSAERVIWSMLPAGVEFGALPDYERSAPPPEEEEYRPSERWDQGGPIVQRKRIFLFPPDPRHRDPATDQWQAAIGYYLDRGELGGDHGAIWAEGPTPLIAAMRAYVASKLGDEVELP